MRDSARDTCMICHTSINHVDLFNVSECYDLCRLQPGFTDYATMDHSLIRRFN